MARLAPGHRAELVRFLVGQPLLQTYRGRRQLLELSGLTAVIPQVELEGPALIAVGELVQVLEAYGRVSYEHEALGLFLNAVKETVGDSDGGRWLLDDILQRYGLMTPVAAAGVAVSWASGPSMSSFEEKIIRENTLRHVSFLERGLLAARSVCFVDVGEWTGTAFLVNADLAMTNHHVVPGRKEAGDAVFRFNYQLDHKGAAQPTRDYRARPGGVFETDPDLDISVIELAEPAGREWGVLPVAGAPPVLDQRVNIVQHPAGMPKQVSLQNNLVQYVDDRVVQYLTSTLGGSSGSPVLNDDWEVVAVHHAGGMLTEPKTGRVFFRNEGVLLGPALDLLPSTVRDRR